ncbi:PHP domain protein [Chloroherpeton thalassium ATCC 35110]|uniref:PHP domain protein n=1 Tax=Chloroherpeton thalassium (strain ATCC 35110 / GB-78) TaxID=517418 RepID=B3QXF7_CHLT3|nr:PHP domain-containing protein [Chloroherpeton thalassium]ACF13431.1 PHP domain protein [Chloroherpeton thalassium ATCC 35110]
MPYDALCEDQLCDVDLHIHTTCSDGVLSPKEIVEKAKQAGLKAISLTDHDTIKAIEPALPIAAAHGIELVPGVEMSATHEEIDVHILGYFVNYKHPGLIDYLEECRKHRLRRAERMVNNLEKMGVKIDVGDILQKAQNGSVGRPHIAAVLQESGYVKSYSEAFGKYLGAHSAAYVKSIETSPADVIKLINEAGGLSFLAHPGRSIPDDMLKYLMNIGLDGIEVIHPSHDEDQQRYYREIANEYFMLFSGGSDFHGGRPIDEENFGKVAIRYDWLQKIKARLCIA